MIQGSTNQCIAMSRPVNYSWKAAQNTECPVALGWVEHVSGCQVHQTTCFSRQAGTLSGIMRWFCTQEPKYWARMEFPFEMTHLSVKPFISNDSPFYKKPTVYRDWEGYGMWPSLNQPDPVFHSPLPPISFTQLLALISCYTNDDDIFCMVLKIVFTYPS